MARTSVSPDRPYGSGPRYRDRYDDRDGHDRQRRREDERRNTRVEDYRRPEYDRDSRNRRDRDDERDGRYRADRDPRPGPPRRSASPRARNSKDRSRSASKREDSPEDKAKPNFNPSGLLAAATKTVKLVDGTSTVLKYHEPPEARKPTVGWRLYVFKGKEQVDVLHIHRQSAYLIGRDRAVADLAIEHPSCSKQHAVIQFRQVHEKNEFGDVKNVVKPFIIDLESTNGTQVNDEQIPESRYYELKLSDVIKFGESQREYVLLHDEAT
ncbi:SMAD/FHA domain-containing protein [Fomitopsis serialis]|uniref:SMAD/FHA domain-containing protein n=1 Tax=Fomitopsis serialis TaxID=139415 RepID=UPI0020077FA4|nr:SMAD/FHA domain-containing protein [Neoantrodia serialis]KAH9936334.1 SMAD/FHA domain-containing protein [Neoantrodia serialis]